MNIDCYFSGSENISDIIADKISTSSKYLLLAMFTLTDRKLIESLKVNKDNNVDILAVFDNEQITNYKHIIFELVNSDITFKTIGSSNARMHHKFIVIDGLEVITGSFNWTVQANKTNMENIVIIQDSSIANKFIDEFNKIWITITSKDIYAYLKSEQIKKIERDEVDDFINELRKNVKSRMILKKNELPIELRNSAISKAYFYRSKGEYRKSLKIVDCLISIIPDFIVAKNLRKDILSKL
jgi:phosphatidylserine/phosphatidylglycerophosphate/cardiolipin synthase-like enzyme